MAVHNPALEQEFYLIRRSQNSESEDGNLYRWGPTVTVWIYDLTGTPQLIWTWSLVYLGCTLCDIEYTAAQHCNRTFLRYSTCFSIRDQRWCLLIHRLRITSVFDGNNDCNDRDVCHSLYLLLLTRHSVNPHFLLDLFLSDRQTESWKTASRRPTS